MTGHAQSADQEKMFSFLQKTKQKMQVQNCQTLKDPKRTYKRNGGQIMTYDLNITFDDNLVTGNKTIDTQHKELIDRIQNFVIACQNGDSKVKEMCIRDRMICCPGICSRNRLWKKKAFSIKLNIG